MLNIARWVKQFGYKGKSLARTFDSYDHADCYVYSNFHDMLKLYKHGYSKVTDQVCREESGSVVSIGSRVRRVVSHYEVQSPGHIGLFCDWLGVDPASLLFSANRHRNTLHWREIEPDIWERIESASTDVTSRDVMPLEYPGVDLFEEQPC